MKKILIIQNKFVGDVLASSIMAENLKRFDASYRIDFFCYSPAKAVLENNPYVDNVISFDDKELKKIGTFFKYLNHLKKQKYDVIIDPYAKLQSLAITFYCWPNYRISHKKKSTKGIYNYRIAKLKSPQKTTCKALEDRTRLLKPIVGEKFDFNWQMRLFVTAEEISHGKSLFEKEGLDLSKSTIMMGVLGSGQSKTWPISYMKILIDEILIQHDINILFNYMPHQEEEIAELLNQFSSTPNVFPYLLGKNIREFLSLASHCSAYIGNEGGGINMCKALGVPTFSIYSPHKFPESWACMEELSIHKHVHLREFMPEKFTHSSPENLEKNTASLYALFDPKMVTPKVLSFLSQNL